MSQQIKDSVKKNYGSVAVSGLASTHDGVRAVAEAFGYLTDELNSIPAEANMGLSCGNPVAFASLRPGEVVVDLGCGGGLDVFLAAQRVGPSGKAIGIDMTPAMIDLAKSNAARGPDGAPIRNVEFHLADIEALPLLDASIDCVISNCVINLAPDKSAVFREIARVLKPGGRLAVSDIALKKPLPKELADDVAAYVGCIAGAIPIDDYRAGLKAAGFAAVDVRDSGADLNAYAKLENQSGCCSPAMQAPATPPPAAGPSTTRSPVTGSSTKSSSRGLPVASSPCCAPTPASGNSSDSFPARLASLLRRYDINDYAASVKVFAVKPS